MRTSRIHTKRPLIPTAFPATRQIFGLFAVIESRRVILPLKGVECDFSIVSGLGEVTMTQIFRQDNEKPLDCEYQFPLPADASVYYCEVDINGRTIRAQVREREEARKLAAEKKAAGFRTMLVEEERENLFTLSLGNVQPGDLVVVQLKYFQTLRFLAGRPSIEIPFCPGVRYIPGALLLRSNKGKGTADDTTEVPDASRITPLRIDAYHPDAAYIEIRGTLDGKFVNEAELASPSHPIIIQRTGDQLRVSLSDKGDVPDRDFVLRWNEKDVEAVASRAWIRENEKETYALLEVRAPKDGPAERGPVDFYFLVDRSGSMAGEKWDKAADALQSCMKVLGPADRAMVTFFESHFQDFAERPLSARELLQDRAFQNVRNLGTAGGTELRPALEHVLEVAAAHSTTQSRNLILITDAQIGNESAILELAKTASAFPVHCFGIDIALNDSLLMALCRQQGGTFHSLNPNDDIEQAVTALGRTLGQPVLLDLELSESWELADAVVPNLYAGQIHYLSARSSGRKPLEIRARNASGQAVKIGFDQKRAALNAPYLHWCRSRIQRLLSEGKNKLAVDLSIQSNLVCTLTAFIAWDETEKVPVASHELVQPAMELAESVACCISPMDAADAEPQVSRFASFLPSKAKRSLGARLFREIIPQSPAEKPLHEPAAPDELHLKRELSDLCHKSGVADWEALVKAIFDWLAEAKGPERVKRLEALKRLIEEIKAKTVLSTQVPNSQPRSGADGVGERIHQLLKTFVDGLPVRK
jgi:Ca-activated chloride channel family protein